MDKFIIGIDPGFKGGIALVNADSGALEALWPMPLKQPSSLIPGLSRVEIAIDELHCKIQGYQKEILFGVLEYVSASPQMGVTSAFRFGEGFGVVKGVLASLEIQTQLVYPAVWKGELGLNSDKKDSLVLANKIWPLIGGHLFTKKKNDGLAEAALLAKYGLDKFYRKEIPVAEPKKGLVSDLRAEFED